VKELTKDVNLDDEHMAIFTFVTERWGGILGLGSMIKHIKKQAFHDARACFDPYKINTAARSMGELRVNALNLALEGKIKPSLAHYYDHLCQLTSSITLNSFQLEVAGIEINGDLDYTSKMRVLEKLMYTNMPGLKTTRPHGWAALRKGYEEGDGIREFDTTPDMELFKGSDTRKGTSSNFVERMGLPYLMYDEVAQGRTAPHVLIGAIYSHFFRIREFLNTHDLISALEQVSDWNAPRLTFNEALASTNPLLNAFVKLMVDVQGEKEFLAAVAAKEAFDAKPEEEKLAIRKGNVGGILQVLDRLKKENTQEDIDKEEQERARFAGVLADVFAEVTPDPRYDTHGPSL
jgi:hypothetical protein